MKTDYSQRIRLLLRHRQSMVRRNKDLINTVRGTLKAFGIRTGGGKNTLYARRVREAIDDPMLLEITEASSLLERRLKATGVLGICPCSRTSPRLLASPTATEIVSL